MSVIVIMVGLYVIAMVGIFSWPSIRKARAQSRIYELLPEFVEVTDKFTRPKVFVHKSFMDIPGEGQPRHFVCRVSAYSDGQFRMPEIIPYMGNRIYDYNYRVVVNLNDTIFEIDYFQDETRRREFFGFATGLVNHQDITLNVRIRAPESKKITSGDYTPKGTEIMAFMKTLELTHLFKTVSE